MSIGYSFLRCILSMSFAVPGLLLSGPFALIISYLGERERKKVNLLKYYLLEFIIFFF